MTFNRLATLVVAFLISGMCYTVQAQDDDSYQIWESIMLTPDNTKLKALHDAMRSHNQKYHSTGTYKAQVYDIVSGPNSGNIIWEMGPIMYPHLDNRPSADGHDEDWRDNVMSKIKKIQTIEYWRAWSGLNNTSMLSPNEVTHPIMFIRYWEVKPDMGYSVRNFFSRLSETVKSLEGVNPWGVYDNQFVQGDLGRHIASINFYKDWADFDRNVN